MTTPSTASETDTTKLIEKLKEAKVLADGLVAQLPASIEDAPINYWLKGLKEDDVLLEYRIVAHKKDGQILAIDGINMLPRLFDESMIPEAPSNFESAFNSTIVRPVLGAFMKHVMLKIDSVKKQNVLNSGNLLASPPGTGESMGFLSS